MKWRIGSGVFRSCIRIGIGGCTNEPKVPAGIISFSNFPSTGDVGKAIANRTPGHKKIQWREPSGRRRKLSCISRPAGLFSAPNL